MTDLYPNLNAFEYTRKRGGDHFDYVSHPVDAVSIPKDLKGIRTQFLSLHHFKTDQVCAIFQNAIDTKCSIAIFEGQERSIPSVLAMLLSPLSVWLTTPFIRPFKIGRIIFTYLIPLVPIFVLWDGVVSAFRTYSVKEMEIMVESLNDKDTFEWQIGRLSSGPGVILYLTGRPKLI
jgi:hypothetical protein